MNLATETALVRVKVPKGSGREAALKALGDKLVQVCVLQHHGVESGCGLGAAPAVVRTSKSLAGSGMRHMGMGGRSGGRCSLHLYGTALLDVGWGVGGGGVFGGEWRVNVPCHRLGGQPLRVDLILA